jgi:hypothetical protein
MLKRLGLAIAIAGLSIAPLAAQTLYLSQDVPTDPATGADQLPWEAWSFGGGTYAVSFGLLGEPVIDALHRMDRPGHWLFSVESPNDLAGLVPAPALPHDVLQMDGGGSVTFFFCGGAIADPIPLDTNVDAIYLEAASGGDFGDLILSVDVPATLAGVQVDPADLVRYKSFGPGCDQWSFGGVVFDASASGAGIPTYANVIGADEVGGVTILSFDVPTDLVPTVGPVTMLPGQIASWDGATYGLFTGLPAWPINSEVDALSCNGNPGDVVTMHVDKSGIVAGDLTVTWAPSCSQGAEDYGIYEGQIGTYYSHSRIDCFDNAPSFTEEVTPSVNSSYYLVVPHNNKEEGDYGDAFDSPSGTFIARPQPFAAVEGTAAVPTLSIPIITPQPERGAGARCSAGSAASGNDSAAARRVSVNRDGRSQALDYFGGGHRRDLGSGVGGLDFLFHV